VRDVPSQPPPAADPAKINDPTLLRDAVRAKVVLGDFGAADRLLAGRKGSEADAELDAISAWVRANLDARPDAALETLGLLLHKNPRCEYALYYRGLVLKRAGEPKAALRDFVTLAKQNPRHGRALLEIQELRRVVEGWRD
jgi:hypothetical protein